MSKFVTVIDDSTTVRKILEICLRREGYEVKSFQDGIEAIKWLTSVQARIPGLIFVDLDLPKIDGYELILHLKAKPPFKQTVFVIISQHNRVIDRLKGRLAGANAYLTKPFKTEEIVSVVQAHLGVCVPGSNRI